MTDIYGIFCGYSGYLRDICGIFSGYLRDILRICPRIYPADIQRINWIFCHLGLKTIFARYAFVPQTHTCKGAPLNPCAAISAKYPPAAAPLPDLIGGNKKENCRFNSSLVFAQNIKTRKNLYRLRRGLSEVRRGGILPRIL